MSSAPRKRYSGGVRWVVLLGLACGCNPLFDIQRTDLVDGPPPIDATPPPHCPALGVAPTFGQDLMQVPGRFCEAYSIDESGGFAAAITVDYSTNMWGDRVVVAGPADEQLPRLDAMMPPAVAPDSTRLAPEGDAMFVTKYDFDLKSYMTTEYRRGEASWSAANVFVNPGYQLSTPSRGPIRRMVTGVYTPNPDPALAGTYSLAELEYDGSGLKEIARTKFADLGVGDISMPSLSADGLRLVFTSYTNTATTGGGSSGTDSAPPITTGGQSGPLVYYLDRESTGVAFAGKAQVLASVPSYVLWPYLAEDCGRMYFAALDTVWYLKQAP